MASQALIQKTLTWHVCGVTDSRLSSNYPHECSTTWVSINPPDILYFRTRLGFLYYQLSSFASNGPQTDVSVRRKFSSAIEIRRIPVCGKSSRPGVQCPTKILVGGCWLIIEFIRRRLSAVDRLNDENIQKIPGNQESLASFRQTVRSLVVRKILPKSGLVWCQPWKSTYFSEMDVNGYQKRATKNRCHIRNF